MTYCNRKVRVHSRVRRLASSHAFGQCSSSLQGATVEGCEPVVGNERATFKRLVRFSQGRREFLLDLDGVQLHAEIVEGSPMRQPASADGHRIDDALVVTVAAGFRLRTNAATSRFQFTEDSTENRARSEAEASSISLPACFLNAARVQRS